MVVQLLILPAEFGRFFPRWQTALNRGPACGQDAPLHAGHSSWSGILTRC
jgi:hypothetical protein